MSLLQVKPRIILALFIIPLAVLVAAIPNDKLIHANIDAQVIMDEVASGQQYLTIDEAADYIVQKDPSVVFVDVRDEDAYNDFHLPNAENIPMKSFPLEEVKERLQQPGMLFILYSNGTVNANQAYTLARMHGISSVFVLSGGLNAWGDDIINAKRPSASAPEDEVARFNFRSAVAKSTGTGSVESDSTEPNSKVAPVMKKKTKKKRVAGGC